MTIYRVWFKSISFNEDRWREYNDRCYDSIEAVKMSFDHVVWDEENNGSYHDYKYNIVPQMVVTAKDIEWHDTL